MEDPGDVTAILSISDFVTFIGAPLSCPDSKPISHLHVFSTPTALELQPRKLSNNLSNSTTKEKIKSSLDLFDFIVFPTLIQFWAPTIVEEDDQGLFLDSSDIPFGLSSLRKGLGSFRKHSFVHKYRVEGGNCGTPARVFCRRFPECCPDVRFYSSEEFAQRDHAVRCGVRGYMALPVFEPVWKNCIGVIELLTVMDGSYCLTDLIQKVSDSLKCAQREEYDQQSWTGLGESKGAVRRKLQQELSSLKNRDSCSRVIYSRKNSGRSRLEDGGPNNQR